LKECFAGPTGVGPTRVDAPAHPGTRVHANDLERHVDPMAALRESAERTKKQRKASSKRKAS
jgi:hypothetical protein